MLILRLSGYKNQKSASKSPSIFTDPIKKMSNQEQGVSEEKCQMS
jgi:hypothetical protein